MDFFCNTYPPGGFKKPESMPPDSFKACFKALINLYDDFKVSYGTTIGDKKKQLLLFNSFSTECCNILYKNKKSTTLYYSKILTIKSASPWIIPLAIDALHEAMEQ